MLYVQRTLSSAIMKTSLVGPSSLAASISGLYMASLDKGIFMKNFKLLGMALAIAAASGSANATIDIVFDDFVGGLADFNSTVTGAGGTAIHDNWNTTLTTRTDYTVSKAINPYIYGLYSSSPYTYMSGYYVDISPSGTGGHGTDNGIGSKASGVTLDFGALGKSVNAIGFEVGDWATCCQVSNIYIAFDNNAPILVGSSTSYGDRFLTNGGAGVFVAAFDDSATFNKVTFWGDGFGEYLVMGGTIHYATLDQGSLPPSGVPEPISLALTGIGMLGLGLTRRRKTA